MYSTCLFCNNTLGTNESIEQFPVGRRIAFDSATGRLWVVCRTCERWNLSPLETRWEAIEEAERLFRGTKLRVSTDNIGLGQLKEGTELVRIGKPIRTEFAAWRYGDQFGRRWKKYAAGSAAVALAPMAQFGGQIFNFANSVFLHSSSTGAMVASTTALGGVCVGMGVPMMRNYRDRRTWANVRDDAGQLHRISRFWMDQAVLTVPNREHGWKLGIRPQRALRPSEVKRLEVEPKWRLRYDEVSPIILSNENAIRALGTLLPHINRGGGTKGSVNAAVDIVTNSNDIRDLLPSESKRSWFSRAFHDTKAGDRMLRRMPAPARLALEMSLHETDERRAMEGELHELEQRWREADAIGKIADEMFLPESIDERVRELTEKKASDR